MIREVKHVTFSLIRFAWFTTSTLTVLSFTTRFSHHFAMTVAHILLFKVNPEQADKADVALRAIAALKETLPGLIQSVHLGVNYSERSKGYTHGFTMLFKDHASLEKYSKSPEHVQVVQQLINPTFDDRLCVDYEIADYSVL